MDSKLDPNLNYDKCKVVIILERNLDFRLKYQRSISVSQKSKSFSPKYTVRKRRVRSDLPFPPKKNKKFVGKDKIAKKVKQKISSLKKKMVQIKEGYECIKCRETFLKYNLWKDHDQIRHAKPIPKCKICTKIFESHNILIEHYKLHSKLKCKICNLLVPDSELNEHLKLNHEDETFACHYCDLIFYTAQSLVAHLKISHCIEDKQGEGNENPQCLLCLQYFNKDKIKSHKCKGQCPECQKVFCVHYKYLVSCTEQKLNHTNKIKCMDCDYVCRKKEVLIVHANREHLNYHPFSCHDCGSKFHSKLQLKRHILNIHMEHLSCKYCDNRYGSGSVFKSHVAICKLHIREFECNDCPASFDTASELKTHRKLRHSSDNFSCNFCSHKFLTEEHLILHKNRSHRNVQVTRKRQVWLCGMCEKTFDTRGECTQHRKTHDANDKFMCRKCDVEFEHLKYLRWHNRIHKDKAIQPFEICSICGQKVKSIRKHMRGHRSVNKPHSYMCEHCGKSFTNLSLLKSHGLTHMEKLPCEICNKSIKPSTMAHHKKMHIQKREGYCPHKLKIIKRRTQQCTTKCDYCDYIPCSLERLEAHINRNHLNIRPYVCNICKDSFCTKYYLKMHMRVHSEEKKFTCEICNNNFRFKFSLKKHMLLHTGEKPFVCDVCGEAFTGSSSLKEHRLKHFDKTVACPLCVTMFHSVRNMRQHFKKQHWKHKDKKFDPKEIVGKEYHYLFEDRRKATVNI